MTLKRKVKNIERRTVITKSNVGLAQMSDRGKYRKRGWCYINTKVDLLTELVVGHSQEAGQERTKMRKEKGMFAIAA